MLTPVCNSLTSGVALARPDPIQLQEKFHLSSDLVLMVMVTRPQSSRCTVANGEHDEMDRRAIACFDQALTDVGLADDGAVRQVLHDYFAWATTTTMSRYHQSADDVPNGLSIPHWSWDGLQE